MRPNTATMEGRPSQTVTRSYSRHDTSKVRADAQLTKRTRLPIGLLVTVPLNLMQTNGAQKDGALYSFCLHRRSSGIFCSESSSHSHSGNHYHCGQCRLDRDASGARCLVPGVDDDRGGDRDSNWLPERRLRAHDRQSRRFHCSKSTTARRLDGLVDLFILERIGTDRSLHLAVSRRRRGATKGLHCPHNPVVAPIRMIRATGRC